MNKLFFSALAIAVVMSVSSCRRNKLHGAGAKGTVTPSTTAFTAMDIDLSLKVVVNMQEGAQPGVQLSGYENVIKHIKAKVENNTLMLYSDMDETWELDCDGVTATVTMPMLTDLSLSGAPDADIHGNLTGKEFNLDISGASKVIIDNINVDSFSTEASGASEIEVKAGTVKLAEYDISGAGKIRAYPLQTNQTSISISGAGKGEVTAAQTLSASISGAGSIYYKGHPAVTQDISGAGSIKDAN